MAKKRLILGHHKSPGDIVCLTALLRDIHLNYPGEFETDVNTTVAPLWQNNPYITKLWNHDQKHPELYHSDTQLIQCTYGLGLREQNHETIHFAAYFHRDFEKQTKIKVVPQLPHGDLHLSNYEKTTPPVLGRYWLLLTGGKTDYPIKVWHTEGYQEVSDRLHALGLGVVQTGAVGKEHWHPKLQGDHVLDLVGAGNIRHFLSQIYHAEGVICGVTAAMHIAAALHKPCVVLGGGREAWWWEAYVNENKGFGPVASGNHPMPHRYLHTIGLLDCCKHHGCWRDKVVYTGKTKSVCLQPVPTKHQPVGRCMQMITADHVMEAIMSYYTDGSLPPITPKPEAITKAPAPITVPGKNTRSAGTTATARATIPGNLLKNLPAKINPKAKIAVNTPVGKQTPQPSPFTDDAVLDHPAVGGKVTIFVLFYGGEEFHQLHRRCIGSILATTPAHRVDIRVGSNALNAQSVAMLDEFVKQGRITKHYKHVNNDYKYPVMREMFYDPACPITTKWVLWFDDDSICDVEPFWLNILGTHIQRHHHENCHMIGAKYIWSTNARQRAVLAARPWYKGRAWRNDKGQPSPNGTKIIFATGGFWALTHEAMVQADIPDIETGLTHTGGDWQIGEQLYQAGYEIRQFNGSKQFVRTSSVPRRGVTMPTIDQVVAHTAAPPVSPGKNTVIEVS